MGQILGTCAYSHLDLTACGHGAAYFPANSSRSHKLYAVGKDARLPTTTNLDDDDNGCRFQRSDSLPRSLAIGIGFFSVNGQRAIVQCDLLPQCPTLLSVR